MTLEQKIVDYLVIQHGHTREKAEGAVATLLPEFLAIRIDQAMRDEETRTHNEKQWNNKKQWDNKK